MKNGISVALAIAVVVAATSATAGVNGGGLSAKVSADQPALVVVGPVEAYDAKHLTARILGQTVLFQHAVDLAVGDSASVVGAFNASGVIVATSIKIEGLYVPGSSAVFLSGRVQKVNASVGNVTVNGVTVDYTALMANNQVAPSVGAQVTIGGTQPTLGGVVLASGVNGGGMSASGVNGGGKVASGVNGGGMSASGVNGGGMSASGVNGGGKVASGVNGGGMSASGVNGGGMSASGVNGGGMSASGVNGGGMSASGVNGGGMSASGVNGGGKVASGVNGGGMSASGVNGGGMSASGVNGGGIN
jgi:hypothetical protein